MRSDSDRSGGSAVSVPAGPCGAPGGGEGALAAAAAALAAAPRIAQLNVSKNSRMHIGPKFEYVTQNLHNTEVVKEVGLARAVWEWARRTSRAERLACGAALGALALCAALLVALAPRAPPPAPDVAPHEWRISRRQWLAPAPPPTLDPAEPFNARFLPLRLVIVQHTAGPECRRFADCAALMRSLQSYFYNEMHYDIPYNFAVGNDGRVYEGRGWELVGAHTRFYNRCALGLGFIGDYRSGVGGTRASAAQLNRTRLLLARGVRVGALHARYVLLAACDVQRTASPGDTLLAALRRLPHYAARPDAFRNRTCSDIYAELEAADAAAADADTPTTDAAAAAPAPDTDRHHRHTTARDPIANR